MWFIIFIGLALLIIVSVLKGRHKKGISEKDWYLQVAFSKEDAVSQFFFLFAVFFLGILLLKLNRTFGDQLSWRTIILIISLAGLGIGYYFRVIYTLTLSVLGLIIWWASQMGHWADAKDIKAITIISGLFFISIILYLLGRMYENKEKFKRLSLVYLVIGLLFLTIGLFVFSTQSGLSGLGSSTVGSSIFASWEMILGLFLLIGAIGGLLAYLLSKKQLNVFEALAIAVLAILFVIFIFLPEQKMFYNKSFSYWRSSSAYMGGLSGLGIFWAFIFNIITFLQIVGIILLGYARREGWLINYGAFFMFILIIVKYFDWFFTFMDKSLFFIGAGILLFLVGWFMEKGRRYMITSIKNENPKPTEL